MKKRVLITGANRGIGLGLTSRFLVEGYEVIATMRNPDGAREIWELESEFPGRLTSLELDVTDEGTIKKAAAAVEGKIDIIINNAGVFPNKNSSFSDLKSEDLIKAFEVNTIGPVLVTQAFLPHLEKSDDPKVIHISSKVGSIDDNSGGGMYAYRCSKTALNMINKSLALEFPDIVCTVLHPGWVQTQMGGSNAPTEVLDSTEGLFKVINNLGPKDTAKFVDYKGKEIPW
jgi:NAD(P)-dependent dehydrogenase (short-subunit alcohol dehydrogenase family)